MDRSAAVPLYDLILRREAVSVAQEFSGVSEDQFRQEVIPLFAEVVMRRSNYSSARVFLNDAVAAHRFLREQRHQVIPPPEPQRAVDPPAPVRQGNARRKRARRSNGAVPALVPEPEPPGSGLDTWLQRARPESHELEKGI